MNIYELSFLMNELVSVSEIKKIKFFCKNDSEMFCSKCILKHTSQKHDVVNCSPKIVGMKRMVQELISEVD